jgi:hypothetical protein
MVIKSLTTQPSLPPPLLLGATSALSKMKAKKTNDKTPLQSAKLQACRTSNAKKALQKSLLSPTTLQFVNAYLKIVPLDVVRDSLTLSAILLRI